LESTLNDTNLRQRLLGAAVILSIGFILYSVFLQTEPAPFIDRSARIPMQDEYIESLEFAPSPDLGGERLAAITNEPENLAKRYSSDEPVELEEVKAAPILNEEGKPNSWLVQVGSFSASERASEIRDQLIDKGYRAYYNKLQVEKGGEDLYRVLVGPYLDAEEIAKHQRDIDKYLDLETILTRYSP